MALQVYLCGHGQWKPKSGYVSLPKNCTITFYTHFAKLMLQDAVEEIVAGNYHGTPDLVARGFSQVPNMTLFPEDDSDDYIDTKKAVKKNPAYNGGQGARVYFTKKKNGLTLKEFFKKQAQHMFTVGGYDLHWCCCRHVDMPGKQTNAAFFNGSEDLLENVFIRLDADDQEVERIPRGH